MAESFEMTDPMVFTVGTVGEPGDRVFFLQAQGDGAVVSLKCEKQQVGALADYLEGLLADLPTPDVEHVPTLLGVVEPVVAEFVIGTLAVAWDDEADRMVLVAEELVVEDEDSIVSVEPARARFRITREQVAAFVVHSRGLVAGGRPPCPFCGGPMDPGGHPCPRMN
ncbi:MAG: DUF3090 family protein [Acidimicrobiales bacterium]